MQKSTRRRAVGAALVLIALLIAFLIAFPLERRQAKDVADRDGDRTASREPAPDVRETPVARVEVPPAAPVEDVESEVSGESEIADEPPVVAQPTSEENGSEPPPPTRVTAEPEANRVIAVVVDPEASPQLAWSLVSPWSRGTEVQDARTGQVVTYAPPDPKDSQIRLHGTGGEPSPSMLQVLPLGDELRIRVHDGYSERHAPSRIRVHGVGSRNR